MTRIVLLRLGNGGEPVVGNNKGVLSFPSVPPDPVRQPTDPLFCMRLYVEAGTKITNGGAIWSDIPLDGETPYDRQKYYPRPIESLFDRDTYVDINVFQPGAYCYYVSYYSIDRQLVTTSRFHFVVPPSLFINNNYTPLNAISMQSVVSKWVGTDIAKDWVPLFEDVERKGYNMIHFTPLQVRGDSNSPYSLKDQLKFDPAIFDSEDEVRKMVKDLEESHGILSMTDIVLNHTANNSDWLRDHPEAGYNVYTAPHLDAAMELDRLLLVFSQGISKATMGGYPTTLHSTADLLKVMDGIKIHVLGELKLWQYYVVDVEAHIAQLTEAWPHVKPFEEDLPGPDVAAFVTEHCALRPFGLGHRNGNALDIDKFASILFSLYGEDLATATGKAHQILDTINLPLYKEYDQDNQEILENLYNRINYQRLDPNGLKMGAISLESPLIEPYFTRFTGNNDGKPYALANNGWIWGGNPLVDFASDKSKAYLRREVIVWGDCVKLRYGSKPEDSPYLWDHMKRYVQICASIFHGFRIDNCHSTPIHVGQALLDVARLVRPNLYVVAELFTGSEDLDTVFVERLGVSSLIREAMQAYNVQELSRLVHKHGGRPIGSFKWLPLDSIAYSALKEDFEAMDNEDIRKRSEIPIPELVTAAPPHALFMDCTHDNETPHDKRTVEDTLPNAALVAFCSCATGSTMGYDECYPHLLDVVNENRTYSYGEDLGICPVKQRLNKIRVELAFQSLDDIEANEMHIHHEGQYITVNRINANTGLGYFLIARTKFYKDGDQKLTPIVLHNTVANYEFGYSLISLPEKEVDPLDETINAVPTKLVESAPASINYDENNHTTTIMLPDEFPQGSIIVMSTRHAGCDAETDKFLRTGAIEAAKDLSLNDLNALLFKCESEEREASAGTFGVYNVPNYGYLVYAGLQGFVSVLKEIVLNNDLAHPLACNLREGCWALDYIPNRMDKYASMAEDDGKAIGKFKAWIESRFARVKQVPFFLRPCYFALAVGVGYEALRLRALSLMSSDVGRATEFVQSLAMVSLQMNGVTRSASLSPFNPRDPSMSAGLPFFSYDYMRCWGRDVFIALRGLTMATHRWDVAKSHILSFGMTLKHGMIPNLLGSGKEPRYNARDAAWFYLQAIQDYVKLAPEGDKLLDCKVKRRFPLDDTYIPWDDPKAYSYESSIREIVYEILSRHAAGIKFREEHAGTRIDMQMRDEGFNISVKVDWSNGLIFGGNQWNCGTWMDKMGESEQAGSKGIPGTPRDGADVEINGLLASTLRFVIELNEKGLFPYTSVKTENGEISLKEWYQLLLDNFEKCYWVPEDAKDDDKYEVDPNIINRRGIYKDVFRSGKPYEDYQLRCNFPIALTVAPELFVPEHAMKSIEMADKYLRGPIGMRTLDPSDLNYRPYYHNSENSTDFATSKGRNYHQGPEWVWVYGYFLRAYRKWHVKHSEICKTHESYLYQLLAERLQGDRDVLHESPWAGVPELTNKDGEYCADSCRTQAWSASTLLDIYLDSWTE